MLPYFSCSISTVSSWIFNEYSTVTVVLVFYSFLTENLKCKKKKNTQDTCDTHLYSIRKSSNASRIQTLSAVKSLEPIENIKIPSTTMQTHYKPVEIWKGYLTFQQEG